MAAPRGAVAVWWGSGVHKTDLTIAIVSGTAAALTLVVTAIGEGGALGIVLAAVLSANALVRLRLARRGPDAASER